MKENLKKYLPRFILSSYRNIRTNFRKIKFKGSHFFCNICNSHLNKFLTYGPKEHHNYICPVCNSFGRHRMMAIVLKENLKTDKENIKILHFAPELGLQKWLKKNFSKADYQSSDYDNIESDLRLDLLNINLPNDSEKNIILSHVLEHVEDETIALCELKRILAINGKIFLQVPLSKHGKTINKKLPLSKDRLINYGQADHVRLFGKEDLNNQLVELGFKVEIHEAQSDQYADRFNEMALDIPQESLMIYDSESTIFVCKKKL